MSKAPVRRLAGYRDALYALRDARSLSYVSEDAKRAYCNGFFNALVFVYDRSPVEVETDLIRLPQRRIVELPEAE